MQPGEHSCRAGCLSVDSQAFSAPRPDGWKFSFFDALEIAPEKFQAEGRKRIQPLEVGFGARYLPKKYERRKIESSRIDDFVKALIKIVSIIQTVLECVAKMQQMNNVYSMLCENHQNRKL